MILTVSQELAEFLLAQGIAVIMGTLYDLLKCLKPNKISKTASDFFDLLFWLLLCAVFCALWQNYLKGAFRWHTVFGFAAALILYFLTIHKPFFTAYCIIKEKIFSFFGIIFKIVLTVRAFLVKIILCISMFCRKMYIVDCEGKNYEKKRYRI